MKATNQAVKLWTKLLIAEYGRSPVIAALAEIEGVDFDVIEQELDAHKTRKAPQRRRRRKGLDELLQGSTLHPTKLALVRQLGCAYENKRYLPELWRVRRFLESNGIKADGIRSRVAALPRVIEALGRLSESELAEMTTTPHSTGGDLGIIADQILGPPSTARGHQQPSN